jgi:hypothetical protein
MWTAILIHHTAGHDHDGLDTDDIGRDQVLRGWHEIAYHFVVERVDDAYVVVAGRPLYRRGGHAGGPENGTHLGIVFHGNFMVEPPPSEMLLVGARHIAGLCWALRIDPERIQRHGDVRATACPGDAFPIDELRSQVVALMPTGDRPA